MDLFSKNLTIILIANISIFSIIFFLILYSKKSYFLFYKKNKLNKIENDFREINTSNIFKERIIEIYHFLNLEKNSESISNSLKLRLKPLICYSEMKLFYRLKASENLKEVKSGESEIYPIKNFPLNFELKNNKRAEFYNEDIKAKIDWIDEEYKKCVMVPSFMGQNLLGVIVLFFDNDNAPELSSDLINILHTSMKIIWHHSNYSTDDLMENILIESGRAPKKNENIFEIGTLKFDKNKSEVSIDGNYVDLTKQEFNILELLAINNGEFITPEDFIEKSWGESNVSTAAVDIAMFRLRQKLSKYKRGSNLIKNKTGKGYTFNAV